jgi:hypothetical protein
VKYLHFIFAPFIIIILASACSRPPTPVEGECLSLPTPDVPPLLDIEAAIKQWESNNISRYFVETEERRGDSTWKVRVVVVDDQIRSAQRLEMDSEGNWSNPEVISLQEAEAYTADAVLVRLRQDAVGKGPAPVDMSMVFDNSLGYPRAVTADAIPYCNEDGGVILDRRYSYDLTMNVEALLEDIFGIGSEPVFTLIRSGGPEAWCDSLRIYPDGSSIHTDECQQDVLNLALSVNMMDELENLRASFGSLDDLREADGQYQRLTITGRGEGTPDASAIENAWFFSEQAIDTLSEPVGLGLTLIYVQDGDLKGFDVFNQVTQPADLNTSGELYGAFLSEDGHFLAYSDEEGLMLLMPKVGQKDSLLAAPEKGYALPRTWFDADHLLVANVLDANENAFKLGWTSVNEKTWHELPYPEGTSSYGCDTGATWSPKGETLAIGGLEYGPACNLNAGLTVVDIEAGTAERVIDLIVNNGDGSTITAGVHTPAWSPSGEWIAFGLDQDTEETFNFPTRLYLVHPDGSQLTPITDNVQGTADFSVWSPDGNLYYALSGSSASDDGIYEYDLESNTHFLLITGEDLRPMSISPDGQFLVYGLENGLALWIFGRDEIIPVASGEARAPATFSGWLDLSE